MSPRRWLCALLALTVMAVAVAAVRQQPPRRHAFRVVFGLRGKESSDWSGQAAVADGTLVALAGWRFEKGDAVKGEAAWKCRTHDEIAPERRYPVQAYDGKPKGKAVLAPWANGVQ